MNKPDKTTVLREIKRYSFMVIGCFCYSLSLRMFLIPNEIVGGGVSGAASLIEIITGLPAGLFIFLLNVPIVIFGFKLMGWKFILRCLLTNAVLSGTTELLTLFDLSIINTAEVDTGGKILAAVYGGILQGIGIGLFIRFETSSGGTELLGRITHHYLRFGSIAIHTAFFDAIVVIAGAFCLSSPENVLYALILIFISAKVSDMIVLGIDRAKLCYIITEKAEDISDFLIAHSPRGVTLINGEGMYSKTPKGVLLTCVKKNQIAKLKDSIKTVDDKAFVIVTDATEVYGKGFTHI